jgi:HSP20 family protein
MESKLNTKTSNQTTKRHSVMNAINQKETEPAGQSRQQREFVAPEVNIYETNEGYVLEAEMPGVNRQGLEITLEGNELTLTGRKQRPTPDATALHRESRGLDYRRLFELDPEIDTGKIHARIEQGVLRLDLPKAEKVKPRRIAIN